MYIVDNGGIVTHKIIIRNNENWERIGTQLKYRMNTFVVSNNRIGLIQCPHHSNLEAFNGCKKM